MKKKLRLIGTVAAAICILWSCEKDDETVDNDAPVIDLSADAFPVQCSTLKRGETFTFKTKFSDNVELGTYSIDIHHNFDHHSHAPSLKNVICNLKKYL